MSLFKTGPFTSSAGVRLTWKIECDWLTHEDWTTLAQAIAAKIKFSSVEGIPRGGTKLAAVLQRYCGEQGTVLIVDDVFTTGRSMEAKRAGRDAIGVVAFARSPTPAWIIPIFELKL